MDKIPLIHNSQTGDGLPELKDQQCVRPAYRGAILRKLRIITKKMNRDEPGKFYTETKALRKLIEDAYQSLTNK